jgi:signal peptidase II
MDQSDRKEKPNILARTRIYMQNVKYPSVSEHLVFWSIIVAGVVADLWSKSAVFKWLGWEETPDNVHHVIEGFFTIVMRENSGAAFSIAAGKTVLLLSVSIVAMFVVVGIFLIGNIRQRLMQISLAMFLAGIVGNLYDRAFNNGCVRDFLDFYIGDHHWPAFNIADSMLCVAVGLLIIINFKQPDDAEGSSEIPNDK